MNKVQRCVFDFNHLQAIASLNVYGKTVSVNSDKLNDRPCGLTFFRFSCKIDSIDINPNIHHKKIDLQFCIRFPQHQYNFTTRVADTLSSARKRIKTTKRGKGSMAALLGGSSAVRNSISANLFGAKTDLVHQHK